MQDFKIQDGQQALANLSASKFGALQRTAADKQAPFDLAALTAEEVKAVRAEETARNDKAAEMFENYFATMLVKEMRSSLSTGFFDGPGSDVYGAWFDEHLGAGLRQGDGLGIGRIIKDSLRFDASHTSGKSAGSKNDFQELLEADKGNLKR